MLSRRLGGWTPMVLVLIGAPGPAPGATPDALQVRVQRVPPGPVSSRTRVEMRVAVHNPGSVRQAARATVAWDDEAPQAPGFREEVSIGAGETKLVQAWLPTTGRSGSSRIRWLIESPGAVSRQGSEPILVVPSATSALPILQAGWLDLLGLLSSVYPRDQEAGAAHLRALVDAMRDLGMNVILVTYVEYQGHFFYPSRLRFHDRDLDREAAGQWFEYDALEVILSQADRNNMHVFIGLGRGGDTYLLWGGLGDQSRVEHATALSREVAEEVWELYGHHPSLYGWYLTHEPGDLAAASAYYDPVADACHSLAPEKPVMVAPAGTPIADADTIRRSHVDVFAYQDAVGAGYVPGKYTYDPENRLGMLDAAFGKYSRSHEGTDKHLWADVELWEMAGPRYEKPYPAAFERLHRQMLSVAPHVALLTGYEVTGFLQPPATPAHLLDPRAADLFSMYAEHAKRFWRECGLD